MCSDHYDKETIFTAKRVLHDLCEVEGTCHRQTRIPQGDDKKRRNVEDIIKLLQTKGSDIPCIVAKHVNTLPPDSFDRIDVSCLLNTVENIHVEVKLLKTAVTTHTELCQDLNDVSASVSERLNSI